jgi:hypothetical protein
MSTATVSVQHQTQTQPYRSTGSTSGGYHQPYHYPQEQHQYQAQDQQQHQQQQQHQHLQQTKREDLEEQGSRGAMTYEINRECQRWTRLRSIAILGLTVTDGKLNCFAHRRTGIPCPCDNSSDASTYPSNRLHHTIPTTSRSSSTVFPSIYSSIRAAANGTPFNTWAWWIRGRWGEETSEDGVRVCYGEWRRLGGIPTPAADQHARFACSASSGDVVHWRISGARKLGSDDRDDDVFEWTGTTINRRSIGWGSAATALANITFSAWDGLPDKRSERKLPLSCSPFEPTGSTCAFKLHVLVINFPSTIASVAFVSSSTLPSRSDSICATTGVLCQHAQ